MVTLSEAQMPSHTHTPRTNDDQGNTNEPSNHYPSRGAGRGTNLYKTSGSRVDMASNSLANTGGSQPHNNMQPYLAMNFIIALVGLYPSRS